MASSDTTQRAVLAGLSCGIGLAVPVIAYAATLPFDAAGELVSASALPFAAGAVAGVGIHVASEVASEHAAKRREAEEEAWERSFNARNAAASRSAESSATIYGGADYTAAIPREGIDAASETNTRRNRIFTHIGRVREDDVPVIARADTGYAAEDAWAQIMDEEFESSPYSCDPATSKDVYQIAIEELSHTGETGQMDAADIAAAARAAAGMQTAPAGTTAAFIAMASAANTAAAQQAQSANAWTAAAQQPQEANSWSASDPQAQSTDTWTAAAAWNAGVPSQQAQWAAEAEVSAQVELESEEAARVNAARDAAMASLGGFRPNIETMAAPAAAESAAPEAAEAVEVPMADYSGHENMWAAALDILAEDEPAASASSETAVMSADALAACADQAASAASGAANGRVAPDDTASFVRSRYEYLSLIQGGTNPFMQAAAQA